MPLARTSIKQVISTKLLIVHESYRRLVQMNGGWKNGANWADNKKDRKSRSAIGPSKLSCQSTPQ